MARTNQAAVVAVLMSNYDGSKSLAGFIEMAGAITDRVAACAIAKGLPLTTVELELMERWLSAYYYTKADPTYKSRSTAGASGVFNTDPLDYLTQAMQLDPSGCLNAIQNRQVAGGFWLGKTKSEQIDYADRN